MPGLEMPGPEGSPPASAPFIRPEELLGDLRGDMVVERLAAEKIARRLAARRAHRRNRYAAQREAAGKGPVNPRMGAPRKDTDASSEAHAPALMARGVETPGSGFPGFAPDPDPGATDASDSRVIPGRHAPAAPAPRTARVCIRPADAGGHRTPLRFSVEEWMSDRGLRSCSVAARGIWIDLLCIMHRAAPYGTLRTPLGNAYELPMLARVLGVSISKLKPLMNELDIAGVFALDDECVPYSRRMRRELESALHWRALQKHSVKLARQERAALLRANQGLIDTILPSEAEALARRGARRRGRPSLPPTPPSAITTAIPVRETRHARLAQPDIPAGMAVDGFSDGFGAGFNTGFSAGIIADEAVHNEAVCSDPPLIPAADGHGGEWDVEGFGDGFCDGFGSDETIQSGSAAQASCAVASGDTAPSPPLVHADLAPPSLAPSSGSLMPPEVGQILAREQMPLFAGEEGVPPVPPIGLDGIPECPVVEIVMLFNQIMKGSGVALIADPVRFADHRDGQHLRVRWREMFGRETGSDLLRSYASVRQGVDSWRRLFMSLLGSDFLTGRSPRGEKHKNWKFGLRWMVASPDNFQKIIERTYHGMGGTSAIPSGLKRFMEAYPRHRLSDLDEMRAPWSDLQLENFHEQVLANLEAWKKSDQWMREGGRYVPKSAKFLQQGLCEKSPSSGASPVPQVVVEANGERYLDAKAAARRISMRDVAQWNGPPKRSGDWRYLRFENGFWIAGTGEVFTDDYLAKPQSEFARNFMKEMAAHGDPVHVERTALHPYIEADLRVREGKLDPLVVGDPDYKALYEWADHVLGALDAWAVPTERHAAQHAGSAICV